VLAAGFDLKVFFTVVGKQPAEVMALTETAQSCSSKVLTLSGRQGSG
jgi:hypothetical protein